MNYSASFVFELCSEIIFLESSIHTICLVWMYYLFNLVRSTGHIMSWRNKICRKCEWNGPSLVYPVTYNKILKWKNIALLYFKSYYFAIQLNFIVIWFKVQSNFSFWIHTLKMTISYFDKDLLQRLLFVIELTEINSGLESSRKV